MPPETRPRSAPLALWRGARAFLTKLFGLFGDPKDIAQRLSFDARTHALIVSWLRAGEAMLRVFNDPAPFVERLSRRLMRRPARVWDLLREPTPKHRHAPRVSTEIDGLHNAAWKAYARYSLRIEDTS